MRKRRESTASKGEGALKVRNRKAGLGRTVDSGEYISRRVKVALSSINNSGKLAKQFGDKLLSALSIKLKS